MGCCQAKDADTLEFQRAGVKSKAHVQALSALAQDSLGATYRRKDVERFWRGRGINEPRRSLYSRDHMFATFPLTRKNILDKRKFEHENVKTWLKVREDADSKQDELGLDTVTRTRGASVDAGVGVGVDGLAPKFGFDVSTQEGAGSLSKQTVIEYRTHVLSLKDQKHPMYNSHGLMDDVMKFCKDSETEWANDDPLYGEYYVDQVWVGGRLTITYSSQQGLQQLANMKEAQKQGDAQEENEDGDGEEKTFKEALQDAASDAAANAIDSVGSHVVDKINETLGATSGGDDDDGNDGPQEEGAEQQEEKRRSPALSSQDVVRESHFGIKVNAATGSIGFGFGSTSSDDDWSFTIQVEGGNEQAFNKKTYRGKAGLRALDRAAKVWKKSVRKGKRPKIMKMQLAELDLLSVAVATDPQKIQDRFVKIAQQFAKYETQLSQQRQTIVKLSRRKSGMSKKELKELLQSRPSKNGTRITPSQPQASAAALQQAQDPPRKRKNSQDLKDEMDSKFKNTLSMLRRENVRLRDIELAHGEAIHLDDHHESLEQLIHELESEFATLMSNWMNDEERIASLEAQGKNPSVEFSQQIKRLKTVTQAAMTKHRARVFQLRNVQSAIVQDTAGVKSVLGDDFGTSLGKGGGGKNADGSIRKELTRPVTVFCRFRPFKPEVGELPEPGKPPIYQIEELPAGVGSELVCELKLDVSGKKAKYSFDWAFDDNQPTPVRKTDNRFADTTYENQQEYVFENSGALLVPKMLAGFNVTLMAYGQTGSGKSFTMYGPGDKYRSLAAEPLRGMIPRLISLLLQQCTEAKKANMIDSFEFTGQLYELYNEELNDLIGSRKKNMKIVPDVMAKDSKGRTSKRANWCKEATTFSFSTTQEALLAIGRGMQNRVVAKTNKNHTSSRSHAILALRCKTNGHHGGRVAKVNLIDLAGSEKRAATMGTENETSRAREGAKINLSLLTLGKIINMLAKRQKVMGGTFRESKLTRLLQDSLGGNAYLMMMCAMSPAVINQEMTKSTAQFGQRCRGMKNVAKVNYSKSIEEYERDLKARDEQVIMLGNVVQKMEKQNVALVDELDQAETLLDEIAGLGGSNGGDGDGTRLRTPTARPSQVLRTEELEKQIAVVKERASVFRGSQEIKDVVRAAQEAAERIADAQLAETEDLSFAVARGITGDEDNEYNEDNPADLSRIEMIKRKYSGVPSGAATKTRG